MTQVVDLQALQDGEWPISRRENRSLYGHPNRATPELLIAWQIRTALLHRQAAKRHKARRVAKNTARRLKAS